MAWKGLTLTYLDSATVNQDAGRDVTVGLTYTLGQNAALAQVNVSSWDRTVAINAASIKNGSLALLAGTTISPSTLGATVATLTTTVTTDEASSYDFDLFVSGFIGRVAGETIARSTLFARLTMGTRFYTHRTTPAASTSAGMTTP